MIAHSEIGASSMSRWMKCPGSVRLCADVPNVSNEHADEGTLAHDIAEKAIRAKIRKLPNDHHGFAREDLDAIELYINHVLDHAEGCELFVEEKLDLSEIFPGLFGTADAIIYDPISKVLRVSDLKFGKGILVEIQGNVQTRYYGLGAALKLGRPISKVILEIVQPRATHPDGPIRSEHISAVDLVEFAADLRDYAARTTAPNAPVLPGDHCRFCRAKPFCTAFKDKANAIAQTEFKPQVGSYDPAVLAKTLSEIPILKAFIKSVEEFAYAESMHGRTPPGFKLVEKRATRKWNKIADVEAKIQNLLADSDDAYERELKSPAQLEKLLGKKMFNEELAACVVSVSSGLALVSEDDDRPALKNSAQADFQLTN